MVWPLELRVRAVQLFWQLGSAARARRALARELGRRGVPHAFLISRWARAFGETGSMQNRPHRRQPHQLTPSTLWRMRRALQRSPRLSLRRLSTRLGIALTTVRRAVRHQLGFFLYKLQLVQRLHRGDKAKRLQFCHWLLSKWKLCSFRKGLFITDEAHFHLDGSVVKQNCRVWGTEAPHEVAFRQGHSPHVTVWCGVASWGIVGPYFFEEGRRTVTVTGVRYRRMLEDFLLPQLEHHQVPPQSLWFQQDGARPHTAASTLTILQGAFPGTGTLRHFEQHQPQICHPPVQFSTNHTQVQISPNPPGQTGPAGPEGRLPCCMTFLPVANVKQNLSQMFNNSFASALV